VSRVVRVPLRTLTCRRLLVALGVDSIIDADTPVLLVAHISTFNTRRDAREVR
jgi:hypothetical protein